MLEGEIVERTDEIERVREECPWTEPKGGGIAAPNSPPPKRARSRCKSIFGKTERFFLV
jgi:hypothetical protein